MANGQCFLEQRCANHVEPSNRDRSAESPERRLDATSSPDSEETDYYKQFNKPLESIANNLRNTIKGKLEKA